MIFYMIKGRVKMMIWTTQQQQTAKHKMSAEIIPVYWQRTQTSRSKSLINEQVNRVINALQAAR
jgi:hypothetical protein